jgi:hypothetical protein
MLATEWLADMSCQYFGFVHGCGPGFTPGGHAFPAAFRYTFPEIVCTNRNGGYDETDWRNHASFALLHGLRYDMSVHLCRGSMADLPEYSRYFPQLRRLLGETGICPSPGNTPGTTGTRWRFPAWRASATRDRSTCSRSRCATRRPSRSPAPPPRWTGSCAGSAPGRRRGSRQAGAAALPWRDLVVRPLGATGLRGMVWRD